jgi:hypothetical protein
MSPEHTNRLIHESSPYLLQHAHNPVDWYAWGDEAFAAARAQNKPIFLSVGYSTCYWCHVMERQSFENPAIAAEMNRRFINIKVDREERPDVDQLYMTAVQVLTRHGGWPMSVFLMPDLRPFYGGTYFPPTDAHGRPGFPTLLRALDDHWQNHRDDVEKSANQLAEILKQMAEPARPERPIKVDENLIAQLIERSTLDYEPVHGGFGGAPKFPRETLLELLLTFTAKPQSGELKSKILPMVLHALTAMADGGIRDHLGGGFHRYSTDAQWLVPHFEIMLYDNAMLGWCYTEAFRQTGETRFAHVARGIFDFILRELTSPGGGFYTAQDAEVDGHEGETYIWTNSDIRSELTNEPWKGMGAPFSAADAALFCKMYGLDDGPNFADPHHGNGMPDKNVLFLAQNIEMENDPLVKRMRDFLYAKRREFKQPLLDTKIITSWNGLMIRAMAVASGALNEPRYLQAAIRAAEFLLKVHRKEDGSLYRTSRLDGAAETGKPKSPGFLDDYAFLAQGLLALHRATNDAKWLEAAKELAAQMKQRFLDPDRGGFYFTDRDATDLIVRQKTASDSPLPSGNAIAAQVLLELGDTEAAQKTIAIFAGQMHAHGEGMSSLIETAMNYLAANPAFTVAGESATKVSSPADRAQEVVTISSRWVEQGKLILSLEIHDGFHLNANPASAGLVATRVILSNAQAHIDYPTSQEIRFAFSESAISVYSGTVQIVIRFDSPPQSPLTLGVEYQACDESACLAPVVKHIQVAAPDA